MSEKLFKAIKNGTLKVNKRNMEAVRHAYCCAIFWDQCCKSVGLDDLPDPDRISDYPQVFEDWLVTAFRGNFNSEEETRGALHKLAKLVREDANPNP